MNSAQVLEQLEPHLRIKPVTVEGGKRTKVMVADAGYALRSGAKLWPLEEKLALELAGFVGLGSEAAKKLSPKTFAQAATELLGRKEKFTVLEQDQKMMAIAPLPKHRAMEPERVVKTAVQAISADANFARALVLPDRAFQIEVVGIDEAKVIVPGAHGRISEVLRAGAVMRFSNIGAIEPSVQGFLERQVCMNGLVTTEVFRTFNGRGGGEGDDVWQEFRRGIHDAYKTVEPIIARYQQMVDEEIAPGDRAAVIEAMIKEARITGDDADAIRARAMADPPANQWAAFQHITWATSHLLTDGKRIVRAQRAHAALEDADTRHRIACPTCGRGTGHAPVVVDAAAAVVG